MSSGGASVRFPTSHFPLSTSALSYAIIAAIMTDRRPTSTAALAADHSLALVPARVWALRLAGAVGAAGLMAAAAHLRVPLPFTPVPVTLQTGVALLAGATLGPVTGVAAMAIYLAAGWAGLPVFTTGASLGLTAGYLLGFLPAAFLAGLLSRRGWLAMVAGMVLGDALILLLGAAGLCVLAGLSPVQALAAGAVPFLFGDALKLGAAAAVARLTVPAWRRLTRE